MAFSYCPHCGFKNMFSMQAPKFCGGCGEELNILTAAKQGETSSSAPRALGKKPKKRVPPREAEDYPDGLDIFEVPQLEKLSYSIELDNNKFSLKDILPMPEVEKIEPQTPNKIKRKSTRGRQRKN
tara:strand:- start:4808 stop:5185 length:378 start_codon:yes stop_codon:yes gene_type:complete